MCCKILLLFLKGSQEFLGWKMSLKSSTPTIHPLFMNRDQGRERKIGFFLPRKCSICKRWETASEDNLQILHSASHRFLLPHCSNQGLLLGRKLNILWNICRHPSALKADERASAALPWAKSAPRDSAQSNSRLSWCYLSMVCAFVSVCGKANIKQPSPCPTSSLKQGKK